MRKATLLRTLLLITTATVLAYTADQASTSSFLNDSGYLPERWKDWAEVIDTAFRPEAAWLFLTRSKNQVERADRLVRFDGASLRGLPIALETTVITTEDAPPSIRDKPSGDETESNASLPDITWIVLESIRADRFQENHYPKSFSRLKKASLWVERRGIAAGTETALSLPRIIHGSAHLGSQRFNCLDSFFRWAGVERGYEVGVWSAQSYDWKGLSELFRCNPAAQWHGPAEIRAKTKTRANTSEHFVSDDQLLEALRAEEHLSTNNKPQFRWIHNYGTHFPFGSTAPSFREILATFKKEGPAYKKTIASRLKRDYDAAITRNDIWLDHVLESVEARLTSRSRPQWVMITSDHGEFLGEHGLILHAGGAPPFEEVTRVPIAIACLGCARGPKLDRLHSDLKNDGPISHVDIAPWFRSLIDRDQAESRPRVPLPPYSWVSDARQLVLYANTEDSASSRKHTFSLADSKIEVRSQPPIESEDEHRKTILEDLEKAGIELALPTEQIFDLQLFEKMTGRTITERLDTASRLLLDAPFQLHPQGEGRWGSIDSKPILRFDAFDCDSWVEAVIALAVAQTPAEIGQVVRALRYSDGTIDFMKRSHFPETDWIPRLKSNGWIQDITERVAPPGALRRTSTWIDKNAWLKRTLGSRKTASQTHALLTSELSADRKAKHSQVDYVPLGEFFQRNASGKLTLADSVIRRIPSGTLFHVVRPSWNREGSLGTKIDISHRGFLFWKNGTLKIRHMKQSNKSSETDFFSYFSRRLGRADLGGLNLLSLGVETR